MKSDHCVYSIKVKQQKSVGVVDEREYIGKTKDFGERVTQHFEDAFRNGKNRPLHEAMRKSDVISVEIVFRGTEQKCYAEEQRLRPDSNMGLNVAPGGHQRPGDSPSQDTYKIKKVELKRLRDYWRYDNTVIKTDRGEYIDYDSNFELWKSKEGKSASAQPRIDPKTGEIIKSEGWPWLELK